MMPVRNKDAGIRMPICNKEDRSASSNRKKRTKEPVWDDEGRGVVTGWRRGKS